MKETYGVEVGDKITCHWENWEEDKSMRATGIVTEVDHEDNFSKDVATFRFKNYKGNDCWFCGCPTKITKNNRLKLQKDMKEEVVWNSLVDVNPPQGLNVLVKSDCGLEFVAFAMYVDDELIWVMDISQKVFDKSMEEVKIIMWSNLKTK